MPMMPCRPRLALIKPSAANVSAFVHAGLPRISATLPWPLFHAQSAAAMVKSVWTNVLSTSHARVVSPR